MNAAALINPGQLKAIHTLKGQAGLDDGLYRDLLSGYGVASSKHLTLVQANALIEQLRAAAPRSLHPRAVAMTGRYGAKIRALWIAGWNLGVVRDRTDEAACAFVERQTGVARTAWLVEPAQGRAAIEALKGWLARAADVEWPGGHDVLPAQHKLAVIKAQWLRLIALGVVAPGSTAWDGLVTIVEAQIGREIVSIDDPSVPDRDLDAVSVKLGRRIRKAQVKPEVAP